MSLFTRLKNKLIARIAGMSSTVRNAVSAGYQPEEQLDDIPWTPMKKDLRQSRIAMVTTAGVHHPGQDPFDMNDPSGDPTFRVLDAKTIGKNFTITHDYYDHRDALRDLNVVFPTDRLQEMEAAGLIGGVAKRHYGFMGHITDHHIRDLVENKAPEVADMMIADGVDAVVLTPGWGICNQSVGLIQREIERAGIPTVGITIMRPYTEKVRPPRSVFLRWPFGHPLGEPFNKAQQATVLEKTLEALMTITEPGAIVDLPYRWRREKYGMPDWVNPT